MKDFMGNDVDGFVASEASRSSTSALTGPRFTLVFEGDIRSFDFNPLKKETPFGVPFAAGIGDAFGNTESLLEEIDRLRKVLQEMADMPNEDNERDAVDKYDECRELASAALSEQSK